MKSIQHLMAAGLLLAAQILRADSPASRVATPQDILVFSNLGGEPADAPSPPSIDHPAYYVAMAGGYHREGDATAGENSEQVTADDVWRSLQKALAGQGYLPAGNDTPQPTLLLVFHWGVMTPNFLDGRFMNAESMSQLVGGTRVARRFDLDLAYEEARGRATEPRFFVVVSAFDYAAATAAKREKKLLWRARMSAFTGGTTLLAAVGPMIAAGAPFFGREMAGAEVFDGGRGRVQIGNPTVVDRPGEKK